MLEINFRNDEHLRQLFKTVQLRFFTRVTLSVERVFATVMCPSVCPSVCYSRYCFTMVMISENLNCYLLNLQ